MFLLRLWCMVGLFTANIRASSHWIVTESGLIRSKEESPFLMSRPFDLLAFMNQETRWQNTFNMYDDLIVRQKIINSLWSELEEQSDITTHVTENEYCKAVGEMENVDWYSTFLEEGRNIGIADREFKLYAIEEFRETDVPDCKKISSLTFSMSTFEHLEGMIDRGHLNATPETTPLPGIFSSVRTVNQYGHWLLEVLRRNTTSWLHYNLAAIYWRVQGNVPKALECSRRAVHYAPRHYKTIPLLCMGSILHRSKKTEDAIVVLGASVDHAPTFHLSHFTLGEAYAVVGDFNSSLKHFHTSMQLRRDFELASKYRNAVLCHIDMFTKMQYTQRTLNKLSIELEEFRIMETQWFKIHAAFLKTMKHEKEYNYKNVERNCIKMEEITHLKIKELQKDRDRNTLVHYLVNNQHYNEEWKNVKGVTALDIAYDLDKAVKHTSKQAGPPNKNFMGYNTQTPRNKTAILKEIGPTPIFHDLFPEPIKFTNEPETNAEINLDLKKALQMSEKTIGDHLELPILKKAENGKMQYPSNMKVNRNQQDFDRDPEWPSNKFCQDAKGDFPDSIDTVYPVFMPFGHKGISIKTLLTEKIGVSALVEHELPWHPPLCPHDKELALYTSKKGIKVQLVREAVATKFLRLRLLTYVSHDNYDVIKNMQDTEIGQRIHTAMRKRLASKWVLYTLASLYWRVRGNMVNALNCLLTASRTADTRYRDVVLVSLASVFLEMGLWDDSLLTAEEAYKLSPYEPPTNFLLTQLHMVKKQQKPQFFHLKQVLRVDPFYMNGYARNLMNAWACIAKQVNTLKELGDIDDENELCAETEPGVSMVCERDGTNCRLANRHCTPGTSRESSTLVRMLELKDDNIQITPLHRLTLVEATFNKFLNIMPMERYDKAGHQKSYDLMIKTFADLVTACGKRGCGVDLELLDLKTEECNYSVIELEYWLHYISFQRELSEAEVQMSNEVAAMAPSHKRVPECRVPVDTDEDFFISRILAVDTDNWGPVLSLMQQIGELFSHFDFASLGSKLARYVDTKPRSLPGVLAAAWWCGAGGAGACAARCAAAAHALAPPHLAHLALRPLAALLHLQSKPKDAMDIAYLSFYTAPKSKVEAVLIGLSHHYKEEINEALWMYRYALAFDHHYVPATACLHTAMCRVAFGKDIFLNDQRPT